MDKKKNPGEALKPPPGKGSNMKRKAKKLTPKQIQNYFLSGSIEEACRKTGVSRQIYYEWLSNPEFKKALEE